MAATGVHSLICLMTDMLIHNQVLWLVEDMAVTPHVYHFLLVGGKHHMSYITVDMNIPLGCHNKVWCSWEVLVMRIILRF